MHMAPALAAAFCYLFVAGASVSTQRAFMMTALVLVAVLVDRRALVYADGRLGGIDLVGAGAGKLVACRFSNVVCGGRGADCNL